MKLHKTLLQVNGIALFVLMILGASIGGSVGVGAAFFLLGLFNIPVFLIYLIVKDWLAVKTCLITIGVFLLIGFSICSGSSWNMH
jgi:hypothetical protein